MWMIFVRVCIMCLSVSSRSSSFIETDKRIGLVFGMEASFHLTLYCRPNEILVSPKYRYFPLELCIGGLPKNFAMARRPSLSQAATCLQLHSRKLDALLSVIKSTATTLASLSHSASTHVYSTIPWGSESRQLILQAASSLVLVE